MLRCSWVPSAEVLRAEVGRLAICTFDPVRFGAPGTRGRRALQQPCVFAEILEFPGAACSVWVVAEFQRLRSLARPGQPICTRV